MCSALTIIGGGLADDSISCIQVYKHREWISNACIATIFAWDEEWVRRVGFEDGELGWPNQREGHSSKQEWERVRQTAWQVVGR